MFLSLFMVGIVGTKTWRGRIGFFFKNP